MSSIQWVGQSNILHQHGFQFQYNTELCGLITNCWLSRELAILYSMTPIPRPVWCKSQRALAPWSLNGKILLRGFIGIQFQVFWKVYGWHLTYCNCIPQQFHSLFTLFQQNSDGADTVINILKAVNLKGNLSAYLTTSSRGGREIYGECIQDSQFQVIQYVLCNK